MKQYDVIVIGSGAATIVLDAALAQGLKCAQIEKGKFGGTCLTRGCIPTKVMVTAADAVREIEDLPKIGVRVNPAEIDWDIMSKRVWQKIDESKDVLSYYQKFPNCDVYQGTATFLDNHTITVYNNDGSCEEAITAPKIIIGTGAHTKIDQIEGLEDVGYLSSESLFGHKYPTSPYKSLLVIGGGPIGTEFAHVFAAAGSKVTLMQRNVRLLPKEDKDVSEQIIKDIRRLSIDVHVNYVAKKFYKEGDLKVAVFEERTTKEELIVKAEEILLATGVSPATEELHLERTDIKSENGWIITNEFLETSVEGVYALGDVNGKAPFRHKANYEADILAHNLFHHANNPDEWRWARYDNVPAVTYTYPQVGHVGLTEEEALAEGYDVGTGKNYYSSSAKGFAMGFDKGDDNDGFVKIVVDKKTNRILGVHVIGPQASVLFQPYVNLMNVGKTPLVAINEEIASPEVKALRAKKPVRNLVPNSVISVGETMTAHPSLTEVVMWTQVYYEHRW